VPLVVDLNITHERVGSSSDPSINGHLHYPNDVDRASHRSLNESDIDKNRKYRDDYNNNPPNAISLPTTVTCRSPPILSRRLSIFSLRMMYYGLL